LKLHRDGNSTRAACPARKRAIQSGANLPITAKDQAAAKKEQEKDSTVMAKFIQSSSFDNRTLNQILVMWLIFSSLPWNRISNRLLGITFGYSRKGVGIYSRTWAASEAQRLYLNLKEKVMKKLKVCPLALSISLSCLIVRPNLTSHHSIFKIVGPIKNFLDPRCLDH
jgi:hypothetical protein